jgi:adenosine deaminase
MNTSPITTPVPKVVLHEHIEGSVTPQMAQRLAKKYDVDLPKDFLYEPGQYDESQFPNGRYRYDESDFREFIKAYDIVADLVRDPDDYYLIVKDYLSRNAQQGMVYCELITSAYHLCYQTLPDGKGEMNREKYHQIMDAIDAAIDAVFAQFGTVTRLHACGVRHLDKQELEQSVVFIRDNPRAMITGFNIAGNEMAGQFSDFESIHQLVESMGLSKSYHAGEICGPESVRNALACGAKRIGHGIASIKDPALIQQLISHNITLEISPTSNRILVPEFGQSLTHHPLRKIYLAGVRMTVNTDDAGLFGTDIEKEYKIAVEQFGFSKMELLDITLCGLEAAFITDAEKHALVANVYRHFDDADIQALSNRCLELQSGALYERLNARLQFITRNNHV